VSNEVSIKVVPFSFAWANDLLILFKYRLTSFVVFSAVMAFFASSQGNINWSNAILLLVGGFCITAASNALNQVLEKDYDKLMSRTADRPVAAGRMSSAHGVLVAGIFWIAGLVVLGFINTTAVILGSVAVVMYAFIYTPLKRISPIAVFVGAIPGAIPLLIGNVAAAGEINKMGIFLFAIQFIWQFPHFWAIGWMGYDDYKLAGYKLIASRDGEKDPMTGIHSALYSLLTIPLASFGYYNGLINMPVMIILILVGIGFAWYGYDLYLKGTRLAARQLMFASLVYLFVSLGAVYLINMF